MATALHAQEKSIKTKTPQIPPEEPTENIEYNSEEGGIITNDDLDSGISFDDPEKAATETTESELTEELAKEKSFADENAEQEQTEINKKTAAELNRKSDELLKAKKTHLQVVPYYSGQPAPTLKKKTRLGAKVYATKNSSQKYFSGLRLGPFAPSNLQGNIDGITYQNVYGTSPRMMVNIDFEWQFLRTVGKMGLQTGLGFFVSQGFGRFVNRTDIAAEESFSLFVLPMHLTLMYRMQYWDTQPLIPFGGVGGVYYGMSEYRDDKTAIGEKFKFAGAAAWQWVGGVQIMMDALDKEVLWQLDQDYGINHVYLTANIRQIFGLSSIYDFSALYYEGGFAFEF